MLPFSIVNNGVDPTFLEELHNLNFSGGSLTPMDTNKRTGSRKDPSGVDQIMDIKSKQHNLELSGDTLSQSQENVAEVVWAKCGLWRRYE